MLRSQGFKKIWVLFFIVSLILLSNRLLFSQEVKAMKKVVMIIAQEDFRDEELFQPKAILEKNNIEVKIASTTLAEVKGMLGAKVKPDMLVSEINVEDFDAVVFIGGSGASQYWDDPLAHKIAQAAVELKKVLGAICIAPVTLAKAGVLAGKRATVWNSEASTLKFAGANYIGRPLERDGKIITASGPSVAGNFGDELVKALTNR